MWSPSAIAAGQTAPVHYQQWDTTSVSETPIDIDRSTDVEQPREDVFGNEVDDAVGDYRIDVRGDVYERHSPETEVSKLRPPIG